MADKPFEIGEVVWWEARVGRVRVPPLIPCRVIVQPLNFDNRTTDNSAWTPQNVRPESLRRLP